MSKTDQIVENEVPVAGSLAEFCRQNFSANWMSAMASPARITTDLVIKACMEVPAALYRAAPMHEADRQLARLEAVRGVPDGWAGPGSVAPDENSLNVAASLLQRLRYFPLPVPMVSVSPDGNAGLFWSDDKIYADLEVLRDGKIGYLAHVKGQEPIDREDELPDIGLPAAIAKALAEAYFTRKA